MDGAKTVHPYLFSTTENLKECDRFLCALFSIRSAKDQNGKNFLAILPVLIHLRSTKPSANSYIKLTFCKLKNILNKDFKITKWLFFGVAFEIFI